MIQTWPSYLSLIDKYNSHPILLPFNDNTIISQLACLIIDTQDLCGHGENWTHVPLQARQSYK